MGKFSKECLQHYFLSFFNSYSFFSFTQHLLIPDWHLTICDLNPKLSIQFYNKLNAEIVSYVPQFSSIRLKQSCLNSYQCVFYFLKALCIEHVLRRSTCPEIFQTKLSAYSQLLIGFANEKQYLLSIYLFKRINNCVSISCVFRSILPQIHPVPALMRAYIYVISHHIA